MEKPIAVEPGHALAQRRSMFITLSPVGVDFGMMFKKTISARPQTTPKNDTTWFIGMETGHAHVSTICMVQNIQNAQTEVYGTNAQTEVYATENHRLKSMLQMHRLKSMLQKNTD